jgi:hypothetical protein
MPGEHWIAIYYNPLSDNDTILQYYDSNGMCNVLSSVECMFEELSPFNPIEQNLSIIQDLTDIESISCGYHALLFLFYKSLHPESSIIDIVNVYPYKAAFTHFNDLFAINSLEMFI